MNRCGPVYSIDYYAHHSSARVWSPVLKLLFVFSALVLCIFSKNMALSLYIIVTMAVANMWKNNVKPAKYVELLAIPLLFVTLGSVAIAVEIGNIGGLPRFHVTADSLKTGLSTALRAVSAISVLYFLTLSTPVGELVSSLKKCHVPKVIVELMFLIYRYIFIMLDLERAMRYAAQSRLGYVDFKTSLKTFGKTAGNLFTLSLGKAGRYYDAMTARCYDGELCFLEEERKVCMFHVLGMVFYLSSILVIKRILDGGGIG